MSHEKISCLKKKSHVLSVVGPPNQKIFCRLSHEKISCLKRKSHVSRENLMFYQFLGPPSKKIPPVSSLMKKSHSSKESFMSYQVWVPPNRKISCHLSHEKISCLISFRSPQWEYLMYSVLWENLMSYQFWVSPQLENFLSPISWGNLMFQVKISFLIIFRFPPTRKVPVSCLIEILMSYQFLPPQTWKSPVSYLMRKSHVSSENLISYKFGPPNQENLLSLVPWENFMSQEKISRLLSFGSLPMRKSLVSCLMRKSHVSRENLMSYQFWVPLPTRISPVSCLKRKSHVLSVCGPPSTRKSPVSCLMTKFHVQKENLMSF